MKRNTFFVIGLLFSLLTVSSACFAMTAGQCAPASQSECDANKAVTALGQHYMGAFFRRHYEAMWSMLHPDARTLWPDEDTFAGYWKTRFHDFTLQGFTLGQPGRLASWVNPETMKRYEQVAVLPISLRLTLREPEEQPESQMLLPPPDIHASQLFQHVLFIAQRVTTPSWMLERSSWRVLSGGPLDLEAPILPPLTPPIRRIRVPILMYHYISEVPANDPDKALRASLSVAPPVFKRQMDYLKAVGYHTITFNQLFAALYYGAPLPARPVILTFDDGYEDAYTAAYPILQAHGYTGMFYIITGKVGWQGQMTWDQLREMLANGMQIGSHTIHHVNLGRVYVNSPVQAEQEVRISQMDLQNHLGIPIQQFCYPFGEPFHHGSSVVQQAVMALLATNGYVGATTDPPPYGNVQNSLRPLMLLRTRVDGRDTFQTFIHNLSGGASPGDAAVNS